MGVYNKGLQDKMTEINGIIELSAKKIFIFLAF